MFKLNKQGVTVTSVSGNGENHGEEIKVGMTVTVKFTAANTLLNEFHKNLLTSLYERGPEDEHDLAEQGQPELLPVLRLPEAKPIGWKWEGQGYRVVFHQGMSGKEDIILINCKLDTFIFECKQGGSIETSFKVKAHPYEDEDRGRLLGLIKQNCEITLEPPSAEDIAQMELDAIENDDE